MDIEQTPPWSGKQLKRLGQALVAPAAAVDEHPSYEDVMAWHADLCEEVSQQVVDRKWLSLESEIDVSARAKTVDTLREKLIRETHLNLKQVQDLAGVRVDMDGHLGQQTAFCAELAGYFGGEPRAVVKDIRKAPHSGYRAVHVWLRLPAGRVEVQVRTRHQSAWANAYERLGDALGREIRYGGRGEGAAAEIVDRMQELSEQLRETEEQYADITVALEQERGHERNIEEFLAEADPPSVARLVELRESSAHRREVLRQRQGATEERLAVFLTGMEDVRRILDEFEYTGEGD